MSKLAIISGGSRGFGLAVAKYLAQEGYDLALIASNHDRPPARSRLNACLIIGVGSYSQTCVTLSAEARFARPADVGLCAAVTSLWIVVVGCKLYRMITIYWPLDEGSTRRIRSCLVSSLAIARPVSHA